MKEQKDSPGKVNEGQKEKKWREGKKQLEIKQVVGKTRSSEYG